GRTSARAPPAPGGRRTRADPAAATSRAVAELVGEHVAEGRAGLAGVGVALGVGELVLALGALDREPDLALARVHLDDLGADALARVEHRAGVLDPLLA